MSWASSEVVSVLTFLLPGLVAAAIFGSLTSRPKSTDFDRVFQALMFTIVIQAIAAAIFWCCSHMNWVSSLKNSQAEIVFAVLIAIALALFTSFMFNHDYLHWVLRRIGVTKETSYSSEWYSSFFKNANRYVVLHLEGERRLYGWPEEWPSQPDKGHFRIAEAEWLDQDGNRTPATGVDVIVVSATEVNMVEFMSVVAEDEAATTSK